MNANSELSEYPDLGTQLIADLLYVAPQLAMHNLVSHQARGTNAGCCISLFLRFWQMLEML